MNPHDEEVLAELLIEWEDLYERGQEVPSGELCKKYPHLADELARRIAAMKATDWLNNPDPPAGDPPAVAIQPFQGRVLAGRYRLDDLIAEGGFAQVWRAYDTELQRIVAVKVPKPGRLESSESFMAEARRVARLKHPGIVPVHDVGIEDGQCFIVSEFVEGGSLAERVTRDKPPQLRVMSWMCEVADALEYAHLHGVIHRDIKPANILIDHHGRALLADFGIAQSAQKTGVFAPSLGTLRYMSPEQLEGKPATPQSDIYSLGVVLHECLTGKLPYKASDPSRLRREIISGIPHTPSHAIPVILRSVIAQSLHSDPETRQRSAAHFATTLRRSTTSGFGSYLLRLVGLATAITVPAALVVALLAVVIRMQPRACLPDDGLPDWRSSNTSVQALLDGISRVKTKREPRVEVGCEAPTSYQQHGGGVVGGNGDVFCMPREDGEILVINPATRTSRYLATPGPYVDDSYFGAVLAPDGHIYCIPHKAKQFLRINSATDEMETFGDDPGGVKGAYFGGVLAPKGKIYCVPSWADHVLELDPDTKNTRRIGALPGTRYKYSGGVLAPNGKIYCMPDHASRILAINPATDTIHFVGEDLGPRPQKAFGGVLAPNGKIYSGPCRGGRILVLDPSTERVSFIQDIPDEKYMGAVLGPDGQIYFTPANHAKILVLDPTTETLRNLDDSPNLGGFWGAVLTPHGTIVGIPWSATDVLFIDFGIAVPDNWALSPVFNRF